jgi:hypothetical protein
MRGEMRIVDGEHQGFAHAQAADVFQTLSKALVDDSPPCRWLSPLQLIRSIRPTGLSGWTISSQSQRGQGRPAGCTPLVRRDHELQMSYVFNRDRPRFALKRRARRAKRILLPPQLLVSSASIRGNGHMQHVGTVHLGFLDF